MNRYWNTPYCCIYISPCVVCRVHEVVLSNRHIVVLDYRSRVNRERHGVRCGTILLPFCPCLNLASVLPESFDANAREFVFAAPTTALIAASAAAASYLDAKFHISKDIRTISLNWRAEQHYARAGTPPVKCSGRGPRSMALRDWCATSQIQSTLNLLFLRGGCKESLRCAGHLVTPRNVHLARDLCTGLQICGILP